MSGTVRAGRRWLVWIVLVVVAVGALAWAGRSRGPRTPEQRAEAISSEVRCPTCKGLSAHDSNTPAAVAVRTFVEEGVRAGKSDAQIKGELADRYGAAILLRPERSGVSGLVWALPVVVMIMGAVFVFLVLSRARTRGLAHASDEDRRAVDAARRAAPEDGPVDRSDRNGEPSRSDSAGRKGRKGRTRRAR